MIAGTIILALFVWVMATLYYEHVVLPWLRDIERFEIFSIRDELRMQAITGDVEAESVPFRHLEQMLNMMIKTCPHYSVSNLLYVHFAIPDDPKTHERERFDAEASPHLKQLENRATGSMLRLLLKNSPFVCFILVAVMLVSVAAKHSIELANRAFWHDKTNTFGGNLTLAR